MLEYIAEGKTNEDWKEDRKRLVVGQNTSAWEQAYDNYFFSRLNTRYLESIRIIQQKSSLRGEGFSVVAIQCSLIEFLESTVQGLSYKYVRDPKKLGPFEYSSSSDIFKTFLTSHLPFSKEFTSPNLAHEFYVNVRCAVLHEACTKDGWRIHANDPTGQDRVIDISNKIVYRNDFQKALRTFIADYGVRLPTDTNYQEAFLRKFDSLAQ